MIIGKKWPRSSRGINSFYLAPQNFLSRFYSAKTHVKLPSPHKTSNSNPNNNLATKNNWRFSFRNPV
jgi:hypothetical protein